MLQQRGDGGNYHRRLGRRSILISSKGKEKEKDLLEEGKHQAGRSN